MSKQEELTYTTENTIYRFMFNKTVTNPVCATKQTCNEYVDIYTSNNRKANETTNQDN